jgi:hypothetical protein
VAPVHLQHDLERGGGVGRVLHVHPHEAVSRRRVLDYLLQVAAAQVFVELEAQARKLDRDAGFQAVLVDGIDRPPVQL